MQVVSHILPKTTAILKMVDQNMLRIIISETHRNMIMFPVGNVERYVDRYIGRHSIDIAVDSRSTVDRLSID